MVLLKHQCLGFGHIVVIEFDCTFGSHVHRVGISLVQLYLTNDAIVDNGHHLAFDTLAHHVHASLFDLAHTFGFDKELVVDRLWTHDAPTWSIILHLQFVDTAAFASHDVELLCSFHILFYNYLVYHIACTHDIASCHRQYECVVGCSRGLSHYLTHDIIYIGITRVRACHLYL